jgi:hypothetical protein
MVKHTVRIAVVAAILGVTSGCGSTPPSAPTPAPTVIAVTPPPTRPGTFTLTPSTNSVARGTELSVAWSVSSTGVSDWIEFSKVNEGNFFFAWSAYTDGKASGVFTLTAPAVAGQYEFRYLLDDGWSDAARSTVVTVF